MTLNLSGAIRDVLLDVCIKGETDVDTFKRAVEEWTCDKIRDAYVLGLPTYVSSLLRSMFEFHYWYNVQMAVRGYDPNFVGLYADVIDRVGQGDQIARGHVLCV
jgi:hypothetical protein